MQTPQSTVRPYTGTRKHDADRPKTDYALTSKLDYAMWALQFNSALGQKSNCL